TLADVNDAIELRGVLEGTAARFAAERLESPEELDELRETAAELDVAVRRESTEEAFVEYVPLNETYHGQLAVLAKSDVLGRELARVVAIPFAGPNALLASQGVLP